MFRFQQFRIHQSDSGMKVCTDATLFGAMAPVQPGERVLDIGAGTGLLALMAAQLGAGRVTAVEIAAGAAAEARRNFAASPWAERLELVHDAFQNFAPTDSSRYDLIISNPPFFQRHTPSSDPLRRAARHDQHLHYRELIRLAAGLLAPGGHLYLLLPHPAAGRIAQLASETGLECIQHTDLHSYDHTPARLTCLLLGRDAPPRLRRRMIIYSGHRQYTQQSRHYLKPFLLRFADG